ncbi:hypothetical protein OOK31_13180 [Streptomyces sp. NBC_00249]|uniref:hypothetical protein n=1 Tax=Streptomyces sp. NBC_00249 TaxID=2975690 RepID=UPI00225325D2|nr:hypothetical protein [Streptomyces sp. NBC_00249]MCX5194840.1 hypothetical protein [Streptomyces sp. NBC_00249]
MADEHKGWLDGAAADRLLRGETAGPAQGDDRRARAEAARLRAALDALAPPRHAGGELPGEAAALAAFRAARGPAPTRDLPAGDARAHEPLIDLAPVPPVRIPAQRRSSTPVRFGLAAALAGVAVGGFAAVAGSGLLDRGAHHTAGPAPAVSVSADTDQPPAGDTAGPTLIPQPLLTPQYGGGASGSPEAFAPSGTGASRIPGEEIRITPGTGSGAASVSEAPPATAGTDGSRDKSIDRQGITGGKDQDQQQEKDKDAQARPAELCRDYKSGKITDSRRERLVKLAGALAKVSRFCDTQLDGSPRGTAPQGGSADQGSAVISPSPVTQSGGLGFRTR